VVKKAESGYAGSMRKHDSARTDEEEDEQPLADKLPGALNRDLPAKGDKKKSGGNKDVYGDLGNDLGEEPVPEPPD
jgi:hypothetical protein